MQKRRCFYCTSELRDSSEVDHFIPWSRYPRDLGHNFVVAHRRCNAGKRDFLADVPHLANWRERNETHDRELQQIFSGVRILHDLNTSHQVAEWSYNAAEQAGGLVWVGDRVTIPLALAWRTALRPKGPIEGPPLG